MCKIYNSYLRFVVIFLQLDTKNNEWKSYFENTFLEVRSNININVWVFFDGKIILLMIFFESIMSVWWHFCIEKLKIR